MKIKPAALPPVDDVVQKRHESWIEKGIWSKTVLGTYLTCGHKYEIQYVRNKDMAFSLDLIEGIAGHKVMEEYNHRLMGLLDGSEKLYPDEIRELWLKSAMGVAHRFEGDMPSEWVDQGVDRILTFLALYEPFAELKGWDKVVSVESLYGIDKHVTMGGQRIAGHLDLEVCVDSKPVTSKMDRIVIDYKFVGKQSRYRNQPSRDGKPGEKVTNFDLGMEMYKAGSGASRTFLLPMVKDLKAGPCIDAPKEVRHTKGTREAAELLIHDAVEDIAAGRFRGPGQIGQGLCNPRWCCWFGKSECKFTRNMKREDYL